MDGAKSDVAGPPPNRRLERTRSAGVRCRQKRSAAGRSAAHSATIAEERCHKSDHRGE